MNYHSESLTRRFIVWYQAGQLKYSPTDKDRDSRIAKAQEYRDEWEQISLDSASKEDRQLYFGAGSDTFRIYSVMMITLPFLLYSLLDQMGIFIDEGLGLLLLPGLIFVGLWFSFSQRSKDSELLPMPFTGMHLLLITLFAVVVSLLAMLLLDNFLFTSDAVYR